MIASHLLLCLDVCRKKLLLFFFVLLNYIYMELDTSISLGLSCQFRKQFQNHQRNTL